MVHQPQTHNHRKLLQQWKSLILLVAGNNTISSNISCCSTALEWVSSTHTASYIAKKTREVTEGNNYISRTLSTEYMQQSFTDYIFSRILSTRVSNPGLPKTRYDFRAIMYTVNGHHIIGCAGSTKIRPGLYHGYRSIPGVTASSYGI